MTRLVQGVGINDRTYPAKIGGKHTKEYTMWKSMLERCYSEKVHVKQPSYIGCTVSDSFKNYTYFHDWAHKQVGFDLLDYVLDKDILCIGNKTYSENYCVLVPRKINNLLVSRKASRGEYPIGVSKNGNNYIALCGVEGKQICLGTYNTPELAFNAYKAFKEAHIKELAEKYKDTIDPRAYLALMNYEVNIND